jgi:hypothetical protein
MKIEKKNTGGQNEREYDIEETNTMQMPKLSNTIHKTYTISSDNKL